MTDYRLWPEKTWQAIRHEQDLPEQGSNGNITVVVWQLLDRRVSGSNSFTAINNSITGLPTAAPYRKQVRTLRDPRPRTPLLIAVDGVAHDPDSPAPLSLGVPARLTIPGAEGKARQWTNLSTGTFDPDGENAYFTKETA